MFCLPFASRQERAIPKRLGIALLCVLLRASAPAWSEDRSEAAFVAVELVQTPAAEVAPLVEQALSLQGVQAEVVVDNKRNQLLVRGSRAVHERVRELVRTFDRAPGEKAQAAAPPLGLRPGGSPPGLSRPAAGDQGVVPANTITAGVRNVPTAFADSSTDRPSLPASKGPVGPGPVGPGNVARQPAKASKRAAQPAQQNPPWPYKEVQKLVARPAETNSDTVVETMAIPIKHISAGEIPDRLKRLLGNRLSSLVTTTEGVTSYIVQLPGHTPLEIHIQKDAAHVIIRGPAEAARHCARLVEAIDAEPVAAARRTRVVPLSGPSSPFVRQALMAVSGAAGERPQGGASSRLVARLFQPRRPEAAAQRPDDQAEVPPTEAAEGDEAMPEEEEDEHGALSGDIEIEQIPELGAIIVRGSERDVERVMKIIEEIERLSVEAEPVIQLHRLKHISSEAMSDVVTPLYGDELAPRQGRVSITPLVHPNALLLIGRAESVKSVIELISRLDQPGDPTSQFEVFRLKYATAATAATTLNTTFGSFGTGLGVRLRVTPDARTNALIVQAGPRDLLEVRKLLKQLDVAGSAAVNELRLFRLRYASAVEVAALLNAAVQRTPQAGQAGAPQQQQGGGPQQFGQGGQFQQQQQQQQQQFQQPGQQGQPGQAQGQQGAAPEAKSVMLRFMTIDTEGRRQLSVGHLGDTRISADIKSNTVVVSAPADSLDLIAALIAQLDQPNAVPAQIKVFTLTNGDATNMVTMLEDLFQVSGTSMVAGGAQAMQPQITAEEGAAVPLRFSVDARTNSIIASGSASDLTVVEAILLRLDDSDVRERRSVVYKLKNAPALDVSIALNDYLQKERQTQQTSPGLLSPFEKIEREVVVVPELVTNSLIVSATPRFFDEISKIVEQLDARAPMVMIQVLIAEVTLTNTDEFGIEVGLQNSVMFDRSLLSGFQLIQSSFQQQQNGSTIATTNQAIVGANSTPGFDFNNPTLQGAAPPTGSTATQGTFGIGLPNSGSTTSLNTASTLGQQALSNFGMGRTNSTLGYGGLVLSLSSDTVNFLLRALRERDRLDVLSRPQIMTLDNQPAYIVVGQRVPLLQGSTVGITGATTGVQYTPVGLIIAVTPRITPDGLVVMEIDAEKSVLGPLTSGIPVGFGALGQVLRQPVINLTQAQTTISALDGQTVVFGGMITQSSQVIQRRVPGISEIPILGRLFRYDYQSGNKTELLIIMTPHIVRNQADAERLKRFEAGRISWCLSDVVKLHGEAGLRNRSDEWLDKEIPTIYPDMDPTGAAGEAVPMPPGQPVSPKSAPPRLQFPGPARPAGPPTSRLGPVRSTGPQAPQIARNQLQIRAAAPAPTPAPPRQTAAPPPGAGSTTPVVSHRRQPPPPDVRTLQYESPPAQAPQQ
ncbi:MAG TPA: secretin N-terminal domain-containing protein [Pirellulales bacterium]|nr:secretin N-terminal domain-containing protein [Pirellulales bacterium]